MKLKNKLKRLVAVFVCVGIVAGVFSALMAGALYITLSGGLF